MDKEMIIKELYEKLWKKPVKKWVKITIMVIAIAIVTWLTTSCSTWYIHRSMALSNSDTIEIINEFHSDVKKR